MSQSELLQSELTDCKTRVKNLEQEVAGLRKTLEPFAAMHREGSDPDEMACKRGTASDATFLFSGDFERAAVALNTGCPVPRMPSLARLRQIILEQLDVSNPFGKISDAFHFADGLAGTIVHQSRLQD